VLAFGEPFGRDCDRPGRPPQPSVVADLFQNEPLVEPQPVQAIERTCGDPCLTNLAGPLDCEASAHVTAHRLTVGQNQRRLGPDVGRLPCRKKIRRPARFWSQYLKLMNGSRAAL